MGSIPVFTKDPYAPGTLDRAASQVDRLIGSAYEVVREVAENLEYIKHVSAHLPQIFRVYESIEGIEIIYENIALIDQLIDNLDSILVVANSIDNVNTVSINIEAVDTVSDNMAALLQIYENIDAILQHGPSAVIVSPVTPSGTFLQGHLWWNSTNGNLYTWYDDGNSEQWVQINTPSSFIGNSALVTATGGTASRTLSNHFGDILNAKDFGAVGDNVANDTAALNAFFYAIRSAVTSSATSLRTTIRGVIPPGIYKCGNLNAAGIDAFNVILECQGAVLYGNVAGKPVLDMYGSRWFTIRDLTIIGDQTNKPTFGIQQGRILTTYSYGECNFINVRMDGYFSKACFYNFGCEVNTYDHPTWFNSDTSTSSYVLVMDARNDFGVISDFVTQTIAVGTTVSFLQQLFLCADFRKRFGGPCYLEIGNFSQHNFVTSYMVSVNDYPINTWKSTLIRQWHLDVHVETIGAIGWLKIDNVDADIDITIVDLLINDPSPANTGSFIYLTGILRQIYIDGLDMRIGPLGSLPPIVGGPGVGDPTRLIVGGKILWSSSSPLVLTGMHFAGHIETRNQAATAVTHTLGAYSVTRRPTTGTDRVNDFKGPVRSTGRITDLLPANYIEMVGSATGGAGFLQTGGPDADVHLYIAPKGAGNIHMGTYTAGVTAITGYITIRDIGGTVRKLAVIS